MYVVGLCNRILGIPKIDHHSNARARAYSTEKGGEAAAPSVHGSASRSRRGIDTRAAAWSEDKATTRQAAAFTWR